VIIFLIRNSILNAIFPFLRIYPELVEAYAMNPIKKGPFFRTETIMSRDGVEFTSFAKTRKYEMELYADLVVPFFGGGNYYAETWRHGGGNLPSNCSRTSKVFNIKSISIPSKGIAFDTTKDHSKWLVGRDNGVICVGDINRQVSFYFRKIQHFNFNFKP
jgi:deoxyribonuclease II